MSAFLFILTITLTISIILSLFFNLIFTRSRICIVELSVNSSLVDTNNALNILIEKIEESLSNSMTLVIIQDDIPFFDSKFYWPKKYAYVHLSDINRLLSKYNQYYLKDNEYEEDFYQEFKFFINMKIAIP